MTNSFADGEMEDATAISHRLFPAITQREKTTLVFECDRPLSAICADKECIATDEALYYDKKKVATLSPGEKTLAVLGKKVVVFPDKLYYDTRTGEVGDLRGFAASQGAQVNFTDSILTFPEVHIKEERVIVTDVFSKDMLLATYETVKVTSGEVSLRNISLKKPSQFVEGTIYNENCTEGEYCTVQSATYSEEDETYIVTSEKTSITNVMKNVFDQLREGDVVEIDGCNDITANNKSATIVSVNGNSLVFAEGTFAAGKENADVTVQRKIPDFTCVLSYENRLWGCENNVIYASALGDATNFFKYKNLSTDSFAVESNSAGDFTACTVYSNGCLFFKENACYRLYGNRPSNFQLSLCFDGGIYKQDDKSIVTMGEKLVYSGVGGIYVYSGGTPRRISDKLGEITLENAVAGSDGKHYFITADTKDGRCEFVWDGEKNLWSKSGIDDTLSYLFFGGSLYRLKNNGLEKIEKECDKDAEWSITFRPFDEGHHKTKNYSRIHVSAELSDGAYIKTEVRKDGGLWEEVNTSYGDGKKYVNIPCIVKGCREVQLRLSGKGKSIINSVVREFCVN